MQEKFTAFQNLKFIDSLFRPWKMDEASMVLNATGGLWVFVCMRCCLVKPLFMQNHWLKHTAKS